MSDDDPRSDEPDVGFLDDQDDVVAAVDGDPVAIRDLDVSVDQGDLDGGRVLQRERFPVDKEYSGSFTIELDPTDPDDREKIRKLQRFFGGGENPGAPTVADE